MTLSAMTDRLRRLAVATLLLVLLGAGSAAAYWTAQATAHSRATAASVGLEQALPLTGGSSPLAGTYSAEELALAGTVTITNTGSRAAEYTLEVAPGQASSPVLPAAVQIAAAPVTRALDCSPQAAQSGARTGTAEVGLSLHGELAAGATATVTGGAGSTPGPISAPMVLPVLGPDPVQEPRPEQLATSEAPGSDFAGALAVTGFARTVVLVAAMGMISGGLLLLLAARRRERRWAPRARAAPERSSGRF